ncbi:MAG: LytTR family transcriptional regulator DNA-binding domain-containing protein [Bacteroidales bacterium]|nr:LytTR family transcriptional regulator DNA-binding domain-containing protein [Bacteroidales bacterium]
MKHLKTVGIILLNLLVCAFILWVYSRNCVLRPFSGKVYKELISGSLLLGSIYVNYFLFYPKFYSKRPLTYWVALSILVVAVGVADLAIAAPYIMSINSQVIHMIGPVSFFSTTLFLIVARNFAANFFPYLIREQQFLRQLLEKEVQIVYRDVRKLDVSDKQNNIHLIAIDDIFYCEQQRNFTNIYTVQNECFTRLGSLKYLEQLFAHDDFVRITSTELVPLQYVGSCVGDLLTMKIMPWQNEPTTFKLGSVNREKISASVRDIMRKFKSEESVLVKECVDQPTVKRKPVTPPDVKVKTVFSHIEKHPNCNTADIMAGTQYSLSTVERCVAELKKQGLIEHTGSRKTGGYSVVE